MAERPAKRVRLLDNEASQSDSDSGDSVASGGVSLKINEAFAKRFEHNAARVERQRLEDKYGNEGSDSESTSEEEDDAGDLVTEELDDEILATLTAIRNKDPRVYDKTIEFYRPVENGASAARPAKSKPVHLKDYQRETLLNGTETEQEPTYAAEQSAVKQELLQQVKDNANGAADDSEEDDFLVRRPKKDEPSVPAKALTELDVEAADRDPETFLSNFMASRAWVPEEGSRYRPLESDEDNDDEADEFETAYNLRFEDPAHANEKLVTHSRTAAEKFSVRREEVTGRKKARHDEAARKQAQKDQEREDRERLRRLRIEEVQQKWLRLKDAAGLKHQSLPDDKLMEFLEQGFENDKWDEAMAKLLGEKYHEEDEEEGDGDANGKRRLKKPKWDDDIDIEDIDPGFEARERRSRKKLKLSDDEAEEKADKDKAESSKAARNREARLAKRKIEELVDAQMGQDLPMAKHTGFRYRETSPTSFGMSARDILMAEDAQLNEYAGLKKLAAFREDAKKARDRKALGKKARLRKWRAETFGKVETADEDFEAWFNKSRGVDGRAQQAEASHAGEGADTAPKKKKKRSRKSKAAEPELAAS